MSPYPRTKRYAAILASVLALLSPMGALAYEIIPGHSPVGSNVSSVVEQYVPFGATTLNSVVGTRFGIIPFNGSLGDILVQVTAAPGAGASWAFTVMQNNATTTATCTISGATDTSCLIPSVPLAIVAGDGLQLASVPTNSPAIMRYGFTGMLFPNTPGDIAIIQSSGGATLSTSLEQFSTISGGTPFAASSIEASSTQLIPVAGTFSNLYSQLNSNPGAAASGKSYTTALRLNLASTSVSATVLNTAIAASDTSNSQAVVQGDSVDLATVPANTPTARAEGAAIRFHASDGLTTSVFLASISSVQDSAASNVNLSLSGVSTGGASVAVSQTPMVAPFNFTTLCASTTAPGGVATRKFTLQVNGVATALSLTLTGAQTNACVTGSIATKTGDAVTIQDSPTGTPVTGNPMVSLAGYDPHGQLTVSGTLIVSGGTLVIP